MEGFAQQLSQVDDLYLLPIYPAREKPMPGVTSDVLLAKITAKSKRLIAKEELVEAFELTSNQVVLTVGAGDIDRLVKPLKEKIQNKVRF
jgi:UDP-N-acetylmuramate--alanine ligase